MTENDGVVTRVEGGHAWVEIAGAASCGGCAGKGGCGGEDPFGLLAARRIQRIRNAAGARVGDAVVIMLPDGAVLRAVWRAYLLPLLLGIGGAALGNFWGAADIHALGGLAAGLLLGFLLLRLDVGPAAEPTLRLKRNVITFQGNDRKDETPAR